MRAVIPSSLISLADLDDDDVADLMRRAARHLVDVGKTTQLQGKTIALLFAANSTRTRTAFWRAGLDMSADVMPLAASELQLGTGESYADTGRILSNVCDVVVARTLFDGEAELRELASTHPCVINALTPREHPTQAVGDYATLVEHFGDLRGIRLGYFGEGSNTAAALALFFAAVPDAKLVFFTPERHAMDPELFVRARERAKRAGASVEERHEVSSVMPSFDAVYTARWRRMGATHAQTGLSDFAPFRVDASLFSRCSHARTVLMHDLPAVRGDEVAAALLDGNRSIAWRQAAHKVTGARATLLWALGVDEIPASERES